MTLDEAIRHCEEVAQGQSELYDCYLQHGEQGDYVQNCLKCGTEHRQLAEWLKDYKRLLEQESVLDKIRAEIEQIELLARYTRGDIKQIVLDIIDKYRAESEDKE